MNPDLIQTWLKRKKTSGLMLNGLLAVAALVTGVAVLFLTFWFAYAVILFGWQGISAATELAFNKRIVLSHNVRLVCSGVFIGLLFVQHFRTDPWHWGDYPKRHYVAAPGLVSRAGVLGGLAMMLAYPGASANMVADILLSGPRLVIGAWGLVFKAIRLKRLDETGCAQLLAFLFTRPGAVPYEELQAAGWEDWFPQLRRIEGVLFLQRGIGLSAELREELAGLRSV